MQIEIIFYIVVLVYSIVLHEIAHGYAAYLFGDKTAFYAGRLTLNPIPHLDMIGSLILPGFLLLTSSPMLFGWAKPVPVVVGNLRPRKLGDFVVSIAGVAVNFFLCIVFALLAKSFGGPAAQLFTTIAVVNLALAVFNLIPVPPADGYRIISIFMPQSLVRKIDDFLYQNMTLFLIGAILIASFIFSAIFPILRTGLLNFVS